MKAFGIGGFQRGLDEFIVANVADQFSFHDCIFMEL
jgi:hypothetical protein